MTLQTTGAISLANVQTEFGGTNPTDMSEYYANGAQVPAGTSGTNGSVPTSGAISLSQFYGTSSVIVSISYSGGGAGTGSTGGAGGATITVTGGTASSYTWTITGQSLGSFSVSSGQSTASATFSVVGVAQQDTATATATCAVVVNGVTYNRSCSISYFRNSG